MWKKFEMRLSGDPLSLKWYLVGNIPNDGELIVVANRDGDIELTTFRTEKKRFHKIKYHLDNKWEIGFEAIQWFSIPDFVEPKEDKENNDKNTDERNIKR